MRRGRKPKPTISVETIEACLKLLETGERDKAVYHLQNLALVEQFLNSPSLPHAENIQEWVVRQIIIDLITSQYNLIRLLYNQDAVTTQETHDEVIKSLKEGFQNKSNKYIEFSILYFRYVRVDLDISIKAMSSLVNISERHLRRHHKNSIKRFRDTLISAEWQARSEQHKVLLYRNIPAQPNKLVERSADLALNVLKAKPFIPILITGGQGVGKTVYASLVATELIEDNNDEFKIGYVLWLDNVTHPKQIDSSLQDLVYNRHTHTDWRDVLPTRNLLLVIDNMTIEQQHVEVWEQLLQELRYARILLCNTTSLPLSTMMHHIKLNDLSADGAKQLVSKIDITNSLSEKDSHAIVNQVGTNPHILHKATRAYLSNQTLAIKDTLLPNFEPIYSVINTADKLLWLICAATVKRGVDTNIQQHLTDSPHKLLIQSNILNYHHTTITTSASSARYIINQYQNDKDLKQQFHQFLAYLSGKAYDKFLIDACQHNWLDLSAKEIHNILVEIDLNRLSSEYVKTWLQIADVRLLNIKSYHLLHAYGTALRCLNQYDIAINVLQTAIVNSSKAGDFHAQSQARYELALIAQAQGQLERALNVYQHITKLSISAEMKQKVYLQIARIMIEKGDASKALEHLEGLNTLSAIVLKCEAYLLLKDYRRAQNILLHHLQDDQVTPDLKISMHTILGRIAQSQKSFEDAITHFNEALIIADNYGNWIDIARARSNFASGHLSADKKLSIELIVELEELLHEAEEIQQRTRDVIGLEATRRNLRQMKKLYLQTP